LRHAIRKPAGLDSGLQTVYNRSMHTRLIIALITPLLFSSCAYTLASTATTAFTGKGIGDHALSTGTGSDCNVLNYLKGLDYYCETRDIAETYNRNPF